MSDKKKKILIIECCGEKYSKIVYDLEREPLIGKKYLIEVDGNYHNVDVVNVLPAKQRSNPYDIDMVSAESEDDNLLCDLMLIVSADGWYEGKDACKSLKKGENNGDR